ncbi:hypothetical protein B2J88_35940 [Rhodococcus sp. SRB_17]|nr:hypothetical protein [Rhodococcus sp. SRB_17]
MADNVDPSRGDEIKQAKALAQSMRARYVDALVKGEVSVAQLKSKSQEGGYHHLKKIWIRDVLMKKHAWSQDRAEDHLLKRNLGPKTQLVDIRSEYDLNTLRMLLAETDQDRYTCRPEYPQGWPWRGKLSTLIEMYRLDQDPTLGAEAKLVIHGEPVSEDDDLSALMGLDDEDTPAQLARRLTGS